MKHNSPTDKSFVVKDDRDFMTERERLLGLIDRFAAGGPGGCTQHPHSFFGPLTPEEWARGMYNIRTIIYGSLGLETGILGEQRRNMRL
jgi:hypothetical protein